LRRIWYANANSSDKRDADSNSKRDPNRYIYSMYREMFTHAEAALNAYDSTNSGTTPDAGAAPTFASSYSLAKADAAPSHNAGPNPIFPAPYSGTAPVDR